MQLEDASYERAASMLPVLSTLTKITLSGPGQEQLMKLLTHLFKVMSNVVKLNIAPKGRF